MSDYTVTFRALSEAADKDESGADVVRQLGDTDAAREWLARWHSRLGQEDRTPAEIAVAMRQANPAFIARNHQVEKALDAAAEGDMEPFKTLLAVLQTPYRDKPGKEIFAAPPLQEEQIYRTFCGT